MAIINGKSGKCARTEADRRVTWVLVLIFLAGIAFAVFGGMTMAWRDSVLWWAVAIAGMAVLYFTAPLWLYGTLTAIGKQRVKYLRGAQGKSLVAWLLHELPDDWHVFHGIQLRRNQDIDQVAVGPTGVWCISTKSHRGLFVEHPDGRVFHNNKPTPFVGEALEFAKELKGRLTALLGADVPWVEAVLAVPLAWVEFQGQRNGVWVLHQDNLISTLEAGRKRFSPAELKRIAQALEMLALRAKDVWREPSAGETVTRENSS